MHDSRRQCDSDGGESVPPCPSRVRSSPPQGASRRKRALSLRSRTSFRVPYNTIRRWETGNSAPAPDLLARVAEVLGVDVDALAVIQDAAVSLASWRTKKGFTQEEVAAALDMSPSTYSRLERGERPVTNGDTATLASLFGIEPEQVRSSWMRAHQRPGGTRR
ncbi:helix-turn-helix domain-containing protein [Rhodococcus hoagii]|nr:helix-turn-helix domain-containing protein [Prescottella equi]NKT56216.1 helix-turn-helix domain-containing protein [Prescottella equi]